ncbi:MAG: hypothetical protein K2Y39_18305 [Candidatus Obscuribacterales bacterium]|nr:hypothetical protein [Candidatus Obscuribacterales bacterium]
MVEKPEKQRSKGSEDAERNPRAAASEAHEAQKTASATNGGKQPMRLEELLERSKSDPVARDIVEGLNKLTKATDEKTRKELVRWLGNSAQMHFGRDLADLKELQHPPQAKHDKQLESLLAKGRGVISFTGDVPKVITQELKALRDEERRQGKTQGFAEHAMAMIKNLKESLMPPDLKKSAEKALRESIAEQLEPELKELREKRGEGTPLVVGEVKTFDEETLTNVRLLEKGLHAPGLFGLPYTEHVDFKQLKDVLEGLPVEKRRQIAEAFAYESGSQNSFFSELRWKGSDHPADIQEIEALFERRKDVTDWAGDLQNDLIRLKELKQKNNLIGATQIAEQMGNRDPQVANVERAMRQTVAMMPALAIAELRTEHADIYRRLTTDTFVGKETKIALKIMLEDPSWSKNPGAVTEMVRAAVDHNNFDLFKDAMRLSSPEARQIFALSKEAQEVRQKYSLQAEVVSDLIARGSQSLLTGLHQNTSWYGWLGANKEEVARLVEFANPDDRAAFTKGEALAKLKNPTADQKELIDYFRTIDTALKEATLYDKTQYDLLKRKMTGTPEIYSDLRRLHGDGFFGNFQKNDLSGMKKVVEKLSEENWKSLRENPSHLDKLDDDLKDFLDDGERNQIMGMLREKVGDKSKDNLTYAQSREKGKRSVEEFFREEISPDSWNPFSEKNCRLAKLDRILQLSPAEKEAYRKDQTSIDKLISSQFRGDELIVARRALQHALKGKENTDPINDALLANLHQSSNAERARKLELALSSMSPETLHPAKSVEATELRKSFEEIIKHFCDETGRGPRYDQDGQQISEGQYEEYIEKTFETGRIPLDLKASLWKESKISLEDLTNLSSNDAQKLLAKSSEAQNLQNAIFKSKEQAELAREVLLLKNGKDITPAMRVRASVVGFDEPLSKVLDALEDLKPKARKNLEQEYLKYHSTLNADLLHISSGAERRRLLEIYAPAPMGQKIISLQKDLVKQDGAADSFLMAGAVDAHARVAKVYAENKEAIAKLDPKTREELDAALENYFVAKANFVTTKRETAEAVANATTTLMGVALSIADPPATAAILASAGVVGAGVKLEMTRAMMGNDFDESQALKIAGSGFMDISFGFADKVIPLSKLVKLDAKVATSTTDAICERIGTARTVSILKDDAREILQKGMSEMSLTHCAFGSKEFEHEVHNLAKSLVKEGAAPSEVNSLVGLIKEETRNRISANLKQKVRNELLKAGETSTLETSTELAKEGILDPEKLKLNELGVKSTADMVAALLKYVELRAAGKLIGKTVDHANLQLARKELFESAKNTMPRENYIRLLKHTKEMEDRISNPKESARTLREVTHFFRPIREGLDLDLSVLPKGEALRHRGEMTIFELANPESIQQGMNETCNAAVVQKQLAFNAPHRYAQIAKDISCYDTFVTTDGTRLKPSAFGAFSADSESAIYEGRRNSWTTSEDLHISHFRRPTEKSMQTMIINAHWNSVERDICVKEGPEGLIVVPPKTAGSTIKKFAPGEVAFLSAKKEHQLCYRDGEKLVAFKVENPRAHIDEDADIFFNYASPHIGSEHLQKMYNDVAGPGQLESNFVLIGPAPKHADPKLIEEMSKTQTFVKDEEQLRAILLQRLEEGRGAAALVVNAKKLDSRCEDGGHVILGRYNRLEDNYSIFNSWGYNERDRDLKTLFDCLLEEKFDGTPGQ